MSENRKLLGSMVVGLLVGSMAFANADLNYTSGSSKGHKSGGTKSGGTKGGGTSSGSGNSNGYGGDTFNAIQVDKLIVMPNTNGHTDWIDAINNARTSIHMSMYHLTDPRVIDALIGKAANRKFDLKVIVDGASLTGGYKAAVDSLTAAGVQIRPSSKAFSITHTKDMVIDNRIAFIAAINMTNTATNTRDFGIITHDRSIIAEMNSVFAADWQNAVNNGGNTPNLTDQNLAWSPNNSEAQLVKLIDSARSSLDVEVENLGSDQIGNALNRAAARRVNVRLIVPECSLGNALFNYPYLAKLKGVSKHVEHDGDSVEQPYMHSKMMVADQKYVYVGSINYSFNSTEKARELGVIFLDEGTAGQLSNEFEIDWNRSETPAANPQCPKQY